MDVIEAISGRRSIRSFTEDEIDSETLTTILEAAIRAPSAGNRQPWEFVLVRSRAGRKALAAAAYGQEFIAQAPVAVVVCANRTRSAERYGDRGAELYCIQDTAAATQNILLATHSLGLGGCWIGAFDEIQVARLIGAPRDVRPVAIVALGKPAETRQPTNRMPLRAVLHNETFKL